ncbi:MAG: aldehyde dehydrogenase (NADP(+)) [Haliscomenobacter sp.]|nr:aldehyde dehydrogenase (NADP(+)) [Haliscomenobacter sp.]
MMTDQIMQQAAAAFPVYRSQSAEAKANFLESIAAQIEALGDALIQTAMAESHLPEARLLGERGRTANQLRLFAGLVREGSWVEAVIDSAIPDRIPARPDLRKMLSPLGPVVVFGASNFPLAFSTAGGDTASALAAGCTVVIKGHPGHPKTSALVFSAIQSAIQLCGMPEHTVQHVEGTDFALGKALVQHPATKAVGFTGSFVGGMALVDYARERKQPIPVFAEMGSVNPVVLLPELLATQPEALAKQLAASFTLGMGQFCTKPGLILAQDSDALDNFLKTIGHEVPGLPTMPMLHAGIHAAYEKKLHEAVVQPGLGVLGKTEKETTGIEPTATVALVDGDTFLANPLLHEEIFGPYALVVKCQSKAQLAQILEQLEGQLTLTFMATEADALANVDLVELGQALAGRVIFNGVPTGVEVVASMQHGGPYPATTDSRFTSVGSDGIKRWARPICFQNYPAPLLPLELQNENPLGIWRLVDGSFTK